MEDILKPLAKCILIPLGLRAAASAANAGIHKNNLGLRFEDDIINNFK